MYIFLLRLDSLIKLERFTSVDSSDLSENKRFISEVACRGPVGLFDGRLGALSVLIGHLQPRGVITGCYLIRFIDCGNFGLRGRHLPRNWLNQVTLIYFLRDMGCQV